MILIRNTCAGWLTVVLIHRMTSCEFLPWCGRERIGRYCYWPILATFQVRDLFFLIFYFRSWPKHISVLWLSNRLVTAPSTGELLYRIWNKAGSCEGSGGSPADGCNTLRDLWKLSGWLSVKLCVCRHAAVYSTLIAEGWGARRGGGNVHRADIFRSLIFYSSAVFLTHAPK